MLVSGVGSQAPFTRALIHIPKSNIARQRGPSVESVALAVGFDRKTVPAPMLPPAPRRGVRRPRGKGDSPPQQHGTQSSLAQIAEMRAVKNQAAAGSSSIAATGNVVEYLLNPGGLAWPLLCGSL